MGSAESVKKFGVNPDSIDEVLEYAIRHDKSMDWISYLVRPLWTAKGTHWGYI